MYFVINQLILNLVRPLGINDPLHVLNIFLTHASVLFNYFLLSDIQHLLVEFIFAHCLLKCDHGLCPFQKLVCSYEVSVQSVQILFHVLLHFRHLINFFALVFQKAKFKQISGFETDLFLTVFIYNLWMAVLQTNLGLIRVKNLFKVAISLRFSPMLDHAQNVLIYRQIFGLLEAHGVLT